MISQHSQFHRRKTMLAIAFASGILFSPLEVSSNEPTANIGSSEHNEMTSPAIPPENRAAYLLKAASDCISGLNAAEVASRYKSLEDSDRNLSAGEWKAFLRGWTMRLRSTKLTNAAKNRFKGALPESTLETERTTRALRFIELAQKELEGTTKLFPKLGLRFIALSLLREMGDADAIEKCNKAFEEELVAFEKEESNSEQHIEDASSVLNMLADVLLAVPILDFDPAKYPYLESRVRPFTEGEFRESEKLRIRAVRLVDQLDKASHIRRKAHRDLVIWYYKLGKTVLAEREKRVLFDLLGSTDESLLYAQPGHCGHVVWWKTTEVASGIMCGMG